jgi:hypothetical protein
MSEISDPLYSITMAAANLKVAAPEQFAALVEGFRHLETKYRTEFSIAGPDVIFGAQARSWLASQLVGRLENCLEQRKNYQMRA